MNHAQAKWLRPRQVHCRRGRTNTLTTDSRAFEARLAIFESGQSNSLVPAMAINVARLPGRGQVSGAVSQRDEACIG
jgi:hypothetical protein